MFMFIKSVDLCVVWFSFEIFGGRGPNESRQNVSEATGSVMVFF